MLTQDRNIPNSYPVKASQADRLLMEVLLATALELLTIKALLCIICFPTD